MDKRKRDMNYFVTGATGLIGRFLVERLLRRKDAVVYVLIRESSLAKFDKLMRQTGASSQNLKAVVGDVTEDGVVGHEDFSMLKGKIDHVFHLAAVYDMNMSDEQGDQINNQGTLNVIAFAEQLGGKVCFHHVSSVAVAGNQFGGVFSEQMFDEGQKLQHPYYRTKFESEKIVREACSLPWRIYRPGMVVGDSQTGEMDKVDGPYYFFKLVQMMRDELPKWLPLAMIQAGKLPLCPVDYVVDAMDAIAHKPDLDGQAFHLVQADHPTVGDLFSSMLQAAHGPQVAKQFDLPVDVAIKGARAAARLLPKNLFDTVFKQATGMPLSIFGYVDNQCVFDSAATQAALAGTDISCPRIQDYMPAIWDYWETWLDKDVTFDKRLPAAIRGKNALITGASSGIGFSTARKFAKAGANLILVARGEEKLLVTKAVLEQLGGGGTVSIYPCDLSDLEAIDQLVASVIKDHGHVEILVNNAGRSIRRAVFEALDRFHDYERTMQLNYFGAIRLIMGLLPSMKEEGRRGHIINISSIGCLTNVPRFSAYVASKSALDAFSHCLSAEVKGLGIDITTIYMPLVRTPMIAPTKVYDYVPTLTPSEAGDMLVDAVIRRPKSIKSPIGAATAVSYALWPKLNDSILSIGYDMFPSSKAAKGEQAQKSPSLGSMVFARVFRGTHW
jgi:NAD(P)-dependent dehydrogenase (short-subunit alcohol dehydrogenase family)